MARSPICDHKVTRVDDDGYKAVWDYAWDITGGKEDSKHTFDWQYHVNGADVHLPAKQKTVQSSPPDQQHSPAPGTKAVGSDEEPNHVTDKNLYWPHTEWRLTSVVMDCYVDMNGSTQSAQYFNFEPPLKPIIEVTRNYSTLTYEVDSRADKMEKSQYYRTSTRYLLQVIEKGSLPQLKAYLPSEWTGERAGEFTGDKSSDPDHGATIEYVADGMPPAVPVMVRLCAANEGPSGESEITYSDPHVFARPNRPTVTCKTHDYHVTATIQCNADEWHPVDHVILQRQVAPRFSENGSWEDVSDADYNASDVVTIDDGQSDRIPPEDNALWYRAACWHDEDNNVTYNYDDVPAMMANPKAPTVSGEYNAGSNTITATISVESEMANVVTYCKVMSGSEQVKDWFTVEGGTRVLPLENLNPAVKYQLHCKNVVQRGLPRSPDDMRRESLTVVSEDIASSEQAQAIGATLSAVVIDSVEQNPDGTGLTVRFHWGQENMGTAQVSEVGTLVEWTSAPGGWISTTSPEEHKMPDSAGSAGVISIDGLEEGTVYRIRLRRYATVDGVDGYGPEATEIATPQSTPGKPVISAPVAVAIGEPVRYYWTFSDANSTPQTEADVFVNGTMQEPVLGPSGTFVYQTDSNTPSTLSATVRVTTGGGWSEMSDHVTTAVMERPTATVSLAGSVTPNTTDFGGNTLTALPLRLRLGGTADTFQVRVTTATTANSPEPDGGREQAAGETVAVATFKGAGTHVVDAEDIIGGGAYLVEVVPSDSFSGLAGEAVTVGFAADWAHPAVIPSGTVEVEDGAAIVTPTQGTGALPTEACRIWRSTHDGPMLCCEDAAWEAEYVDQWPAYGWDGCAYLIESVSADGDHRWAEIPYTLQGGSLKVDFGEQLELPFNLERKSSWENTFERRSHMDGSRTGFWEPGYDRDYTASGDIPKNDLATAQLVSRLGQHAGICLVRANHGVCFAAHVSTSIDESYMEGRLSVDLSCEQVDDDGTFNLTRRA